MGGGGGGPEELLEGEGKEEGVAVLPPTLADLLPTCVGVIRGGEQLRSPDGRYCKATGFVLEEAAMEADEF